MRDIRNWIAKVGMAVLLVTASLGLPLVGIVQATGSGYETFEDGSNGEWNGGNVVNTGYSGDKSLKISSQLVRWNDGSKTVNSSNAEFTALMKTGTGGVRAGFDAYSSNGNVGIDLKTDLNEVVYKAYDNSAQDSYTVSRSLSGGDWWYIKWEIKSETFRGKIWRAGNDEPANWTWKHTLSNSFSGADIRWDADSGKAWADGTGFMQTVPSLATYTVSGSVKSSDGSGIGSATVATNTSSSTTTANDGSWSMDLADGTYKITASKSGYQPESKTITVSGSSVSGVDYTLTGNLTGRVTDEQGNAVSGANVSTGTGVATTTNATGYYGLALSDGNYTISVQSDTGTLSKDVTVAGPTTANFGYGFEQAFHMDDRTNGSLFADYDSELIVERPDSSVTTTTFNHNDSAYVGVQAGERYNLTVVSDAPAVVETWFVPVESIPSAPLILGSEEHGTAVPDDELRANYTTGPDSNRSTVSYTAPNETTIKDIDYTIEDGDGDPVVNVTREFDQPVEYYQRDFNQTRLNQTAGNDTDLDDATVEYSGTYANGTAFNGTTDLSFDSGFSGIGGPTGSTGGGNGTVQTIAGVALLGGGAFVAARRFNIGQTVAQAARRLGP